MPMVKISGHSKLSGPSSQFLLNEARNKETDSLRARKRAKMSGVPSSARSKRKFPQRYANPDSAVDTEGVIGNTDRGKVTRFNTFPCESASIQCVCLRLKKILKGRALSCNRTRSADALRDRTSHFL